MLAFFDENYTAITVDPLRTHHNGYSGGVNENIFYVRNSDPATYYADIIVTPKFRLSYLEDTGINGNTGWSIKLLYGSSKPTREEWDSVDSGEELLISDIGTVEASDTSTFHPIWYRVYCPGNTEAQIRKNMYIEVSFNEKQVVL